MRHVKSPAFRNAPFANRSLGKNPNFIIQFREMEVKGTHPILIATYLHDELARIHPFIDGNGRTSRLLMNLYLLQHGFIIVNLKGSNEAKHMYYNALETSHTQKRPESFQKLVAESEKASLKRYLSILGAPGFEK